MSAPDQDAWGMMIVPITLFKYTLAVVFGVYMAAIGIGFQNWKFYPALAVFIGYGVLNYIEARRGL